MVKKGIHILDKEQMTMLYLAQECGLNFSMFKIYTIDWCVAFYVLYCCLSDNVFHIHWSSACE